MGLNKLGNPIVHKLANRFKKSVHILFNTIGNNSAYPTMWKRSEIGPIHKNGEKQSVISYRPIRLLFPVSKVLERFIFDKMSAHIFKQLHESKFGFRPKRWTTVQMLKYLNEAS